MLGGNANMIGAIRVRLCLHEEKKSVRLHGTNALICIYKFNGRIDPL